MTVRRRRRLWSLALAGCLTAGPAVMAMGPVGPAFAAGQGGSAPGPAAANTSDNFLRAVAAISPTNIWAVGYFCIQACNGNNTVDNIPNTLIEHYNGHGWHVVASPNVGAFGNELFGVAAVCPPSQACSPTNVWAVGKYFTSAFGGNPQTLIEHFNGSSWSVVPSPDPGTTDGLNAVTALSPADAWAVGGYGTSTGGATQTLTEQWNGTNWNVVTSPDPLTSNELYGTSAISPTDVWAVGTGAQTQNYNGTSWSEFPSPVTGTLYSVAPVCSPACSDTNVWAAGFQPSATGVDQTLTEQWNGSTWSVVSSPDAPGHGNLLQGVAPVSPADVWAAGWYETRSFTYKTLIEQYNGSSWSIVASPSPGVGTSILFGVAAVCAPACSPTNVWAVGYDYNSSNFASTLIEHYTGTTWTRVPSPNES